RVSARTSASAAPPTRSEVQSASDSPGATRPGSSASSSPASERSSARAPSVAGQELAREPADVARAHEEHQVAGARELAQLGHDRRLLRHELARAVTAGAHRLGE